MLPATWLDSEMDPRKQITLAQGSIDAQIEGSTMGAGDHPEQLR